MKVSAEFCKVLLSHQRDAEWKAPLRSARRSGAEKMREDREDAAVETFQEKKLVMGI